MDEHNNCENRAWNKNYAATDASEIIYAPFVINTIFHKKSCVPNCNYVGVILPEAYMQNMKPESSM